MAECMTESSPKASEREKDRGDECAGGGGGRRVRGRGKEESQNGGNLWEVSVG